MMCVEAHHIVGGIGYLILDSVIEYALGKKGPRIGSSKIEVLIYAIRWIWNSLRRNKDERTTRQD